MYSYQYHLLDVFGWTPVEHSGGVVSFDVVVHRLHLIVSWYENRIMPGRNKTQTNSSLDDLIITK